MTTQSQAPKSCTNCDHWDTRHYPHCTWGTMPVTYDERGVARRSDPDKDSCENWRPIFNEPLEVGG